ncbi:MAG TPA: tRNA pseudouridine(54/55) synthase Pus10 [Candidatus Methanomethylophilaceae archaeon]|nr:tRNA pseudouridine(54/55) synthase Pus10 [Candidatus Methanomethylophilaceae archaeon]
MDDWIEINIEKAERLAERGLCNRCLGRMFGKEGTGMTNDVRGDMLRGTLISKDMDLPPKEVCPLCGNIFDLLPRFAEAVSDIVHTVESDDFLIGTKVDPIIISMEKELVEEFGLEKSESIKTELNREIGKLSGPLVQRRVEFSDPQVVACIDTRFADVELDIKPIFISGRYNKLSREIPQTIWPCRSCRGKGCPRCDGVGKMYHTSVQEIIGDIALEMAGGEEHFFHGMGREDIDALMLGDGRPFVLEISSPKVRKIDLEELQNRANQSELAQYNSLQFTERDTVKLYKGSDPDKVYLARVRAESKVNMDKLIEVALTFKDVRVDQRTPVRVAHRRADLVRNRGIRWVEVELVDEYTFDLTLETESGTYVKEFVSGDGGRSVPNFSDSLGVPCVVQELDVLAIKYE